MQLVEILNNCLEAVLFFTLLQVTIGYEKKYKFFAVTGWLVIAAFTTFANYYNLNTVLFYIIAVIIEFSYAAIFFDHANNLRFLYAFSLVVFSTIANFITIFTISLVQPQNVPYIIEGNPAVRLEIIVLYSLTLLLLFVPAMFIKPKKMLFRKRHLVAMLLLLLMSTCCTVVMLYFTIQNADIIDSLLPLGIICVILLTVILAIIALFYRLAVMDKKNYDEQLELNQLRSEKARFEQTQATFDYLRKAKHDFKIHLRTIHRMTGQSGNDEIAKYVSELIDETPDSTFGVYTGNTAIDAVITEYALTAAKKNIDFSTTVIAPEKMPMSDVEFCSCIGNLMDNAFEACAKVDGNKFIKLVIDYSKDTLRIRVRNRSNGVYRKNGKGLVTVKANSLLHGIGIKRIKEIVAKHDGMCSFFPKEDYFEAILYLPI